MPPPPLANYSRVYLALDVVGAKLRLRASLKMPVLTGNGFALLSRGAIMGDDAVEIDLPLEGAPGKSAYQLARDHGYGGTETQWLAQLAGRDGKDGKDGLSGSNGRDGSNGAPGKDGVAGKDGATGRDASALLGSVTVAETATIAIAAGPRRRTITVPASLGLAAGDAILMKPKTPPTLGYRIEDAWATSATQITAELTVPLIAIGGGYSIDCWLFRLRTA